MVPISSAAQVKRSRILLVGGGHAHLHLLKQWQTHGIHGAEMILLSPSRYQYYSGMIAGYIEGYYKLEEIRIDLLALCTAGGVQFIQAAATSVNPIRQTVQLADEGEELSYDVISFDIGSETAGRDLPGVRAFATPVKPIEDYVRHARRIKSCSRIVVVGAGASGVEQSLALRAGQKRHEGEGTVPFAGSVTLLSAGALLGRASQREQDYLERMMKQKEVTLRMNDPVIEVKQEQVLLQSGTAVPYDELLWLTGAKASDLFLRSGLTTCDDGYLLVQDSLQSVDHPNIFGAGDCITIADHAPIPKAGVYAVREAPILWANIQRFLAGQPSVRYRPQSAFLSLIGTGQDEGLLQYRAIMLRGAWCLRLKRYIDEKFVKQYQ